MRACRQRAHRPTFGCSGSLMQVVPFALRVVRCAVGNGDGFRGPSVASRARTADANGLSGWRAAHSHVRAASGPRLAEKRHRSVFSARIGVWCGDSSTGGRSTRGRALEFRGTGWVRSTSRWRSGGRSPLEQGSALEAARSGWRRLPTGVIRGWMRRVSLTLSPRPDGGEVHGLAAAPFHGQPGNRGPRSLHSPPMHFRPLPRPLRPA